MKTKTKKIGMLDCKTPNDLIKENLLCEKCANSIIDGRGESYYGHWQYYALVCPFVKNKYGEYVELDGGDNCSAPDEDFPDGYIELIVECEKFEMKDFQHTTQKRGSNDSHVSF